MVKGEDGVYLFCGDEDFLKEEALKRLISTLIPSKSERLNCDIYNAKDDYSDISNALKSFPLLSDKRVIVIKDVEYIPEPKKNGFLSYLRHPSKHICVILQSKETPLSNKFLKTVSHYAKTFLYNKLTRTKTIDWIHKRVNQHKKSITKDALELLLELKGSSDLAIISEELEKLITYKADEKSIEAKDVAELVGKSATKNAFDLIEAVSLKNRDAALSVVHELLLNNKKGIPEIMGLMGWQLRRMWKAKPSRFNTEELKRDIGLLVEADHRIKSGYDRPEFILEDLILKLCS